MINVDRNSVPNPLERYIDRVNKMRDKARTFYSEERKQQRFDISKNMQWIRKIVKGPLLELFHNKCAFCETPIGDIGNMDIETFRPRGGAVGIDGKRDPDHYWWIASDWNNLYASCPACNRTKGTRFPVFNNLRAPIEASWSQLREEPVLLLDPCIDHPEEHLVFNEDGSVAAMHVDDLPQEEIERFGKPTRGQVTIDTFALNRPALVETRKSESRRFLNLIVDNEFRFNQDTNAIQNFIEKYLTLDTSFLQMKRQLLQTWIKQNLVSAINNIQQAQDYTDKASSEVERSRAFEQQFDYEEQIKTSSVENEGDSDSYHARAAYVERVEINGFTSMENFSFTFNELSSGSGENASWLMLLGENGVGKSSVLKAIALALSGPRRYEELRNEPVMQDLPNLFHNEGYVRVYISAQSEPLEVRREGDSLTYYGYGSGSKVFVRAFGPSRWFPLPGSQAPENDAYVRIENLFNPFIPLESGEVYLTKIDETRWDEVAMGLKALLDIPEVGVLTIKDGNVMVQVSGEGARPLRALSSGYEAMIAMSVDLIHMLFQRWESIHDAEGIVLLDEIGAHLQPRWKMRIVESLRNTFPRVQFIATTHEPLCLRGLYDGEILVMRRYEDEDTGELSKVKPYRPVQDVSELRIDQILTSRMFGLSSTLDPELEEEFDRYYKLLSRHKTALSEQEKNELDELKSTVGKRGILGSTRRDQMIYQIIDEFIAKELTFLNEEERIDQERWTKEQVADFWTKVPDSEELQS